MSAKIHLRVEDAHVGRVLAERYRRDRVQPDWRDSMIRRQRAENITSKGIM